MNHCPVDGGLNYGALPYYYEWKNKRFQFVKCKQCGLVTIDPKPTEEELNELYGEEYFDHGAHGLNQQHKSYEDVRDAVPLAEREKNFRNKILKFHPSAKSIFEIGAAMGYQLNAAQLCGLKTGGLEISEAANKRAKEKFGLHLYKGDFERIDLTNEFGKWDLVYGGDVFEHFSNPDIVVKKIHQLLAPGGKAIIIVPSTFNLFSTSIATSLLKLSGRKMKLPDNPYHLFEYTSSSMKIIFQKEFKHVQILNQIKKPSELNMKSGSMSYQLKRVVHFINYPFTKMFNSNGDRLTLIANN